MMSVRVPVRGAEQGPPEARVVAGPVVPVADAHAGELVGRVVVVGGGCCGGRVVVLGRGHGLVVVLGADYGARGPGGRRLQVTRHVAREASQLTRHSAGEDVYSR